jgi:hypothetical protein
MRKEQKNVRIKEKRQTTNYEVGDNVRLRVLKNKMSKYTVPIGAKQFTQLQG